MPKCFKKIFYLDNGEFALAGKANGIPLEKMLNKLKEYQREINNSTINIRGLDYDISIVISVATGKDAYENARLGIRKILNEHHSFILATGLKEKMKKVAKQNLEVLHLVKRALEQKLFVCMYQPIINNHTGKVEKYETLIRINQDGNLITPGVFLDIAKKGSFYSRITYEVLNLSFEKLKQLEGLSINISEIDIERASTRNYIYKLLQENQDVAKRVTFELLEDANSKNCEELEEFIREIKALGVKIAIDDFGTGYSNFIRLKKYQPDFLKIDGTLIKDLPNDEFSQSIVKAIVDFAKSNNIKTIAEFVENEDIYNKVCELGIDYSQGYYFSKPVLI
jgi:EAL domain-containing protein (putative c-di-GMP-specific phosphodiesterase class I)